MLTHRNHISQVTTAIVLACLTVLASGTARAEDDTMPPVLGSPPRVELVGSSIFELTPGEADTLDSINAERAWATGLYVASSVTLVGAGVAVFPAMLGAAFHQPELAAIPIVVGGAGLVMLGVAIGLHIDSGSRRAGLLRDVRARIELTSNGVSLSGTF